MHLLIQETLVPSLDQEDSLEKEMATHSSVFTWGILWTEEPGGLRSMGVAKSQTWLSNTTTLSPHGCSFKSWERLKFHSELQTKTPVARVKSSTLGVGEGREDPDALPLHFLPVLPLLGCPSLLTSPYWPTFFFWTPRVDVLTSLAADVHLRDPAGPQQAPAHGSNRRCMLAARSLPKDGAAVSGYFILLYSRCYWPFCGLWILNVLNIVIASWSLYGGRVATCFQFSDVETWGLVYVSDVPLLLECRRRWHVCDALGAVPDVCQYEHVCVSRLCLPLKPTLPPNSPSPLATRLMHIPDL